MRLLLVLDPWGWAAASPSLALRFFFLVAVVVGLIADLVAAGLVLDLPALVVSMAARGLVFLPDVDFLPPAEVAAAVAATAEGWGWEEEGKGGSWVALDWRWSLLQQLRVGVNVRGRVRVGVGVGRKVRGWSVLGHEVLS